MMTKSFFIIASSQLRCRPCSPRTCAATASLCFTDSTFTEYSQLLRHTASLGKLFSSYAGLPEKRWRCRKALRSFFVRYDLRRRQEGRRRQSGNVSVATSLRWNFFPSRHLLENPTSTAVWRNSVLRLEINMRPSDPSLRPTGGNSQKKLHFYYFLSWLQIHVIRHRNLQFFQSTLTESLYKK